MIIIPQEPSFHPRIRSFKRSNKGWRVGVDEGASLTGGGYTLAKQAISIATDRWVMRGDAHPLTTDAIYTANTCLVITQLRPRFNASNRPVRANNEQSALRIIVSDSVCNTLSDTTRQAESRISRTCRRANKGGGRAQCKGIAFAGSVSFQWAGGGKQLGEPTLSIAI